MRKLLPLLSVFILIFVAVMPSTAQDEEIPLVGDVLLERASNPDEPEFSMLWAALQIADPAYLQRITDPDMAAATFTTVFAPTDAAFQAFLEEMGVTTEELFADPARVSQVLAYHILPGVFTAENFATRESALYGTFVPHTALTIGGDGETVTVDGATVVEADIPAFNGAIHVIDKVLVPATLDAEMEAEELPEETLYDILSSREEFSYFLELMDMMGFQTDLQVTNYTLFLPTNDVFDAFFEAQGVTKEELFANTDTITPIAFYHFLSGAFTAEDLAALQGENENAVFGTQQPGTFMTIVVDGENVTIDGGAATVVEPDIRAKNGVIHVIDSILLPSGS